MVYLLHDNTDFWGTEKITIHLALLTFNSSMYAAQGPVWSTVVDCELNFI